MVGLLAKESFFPAFRIYLGKNSYNLKNMCSLLKKMHSFQVPCVSFPGAGGMRAQQGWLYAASLATWQNQQLGRSGSGWGVHLVIEGCAWSCLMTYQASG